MTPTQRIAARWYVYGYLREVVPMYPVYAIMMGSRGVSPFELSVLFIVWSVSALVFEVPSGVLADRYSRKRLLVLAGIVKGLAFVVWWLTPQFGGYLLGFVVWGFGSSLTSGTAESLLYDALRAQRDEAAFARVYGRTRVAASLGIATGLASGGYLAEHGYELPLLLSIAAPWSSALVVAVTFAEPPRSGAKHYENFWTTLRGGVAEVRGNVALLRIVAMFATLVTAYGVIDEYVGPFLHEAPQLSLGAIGVVYATVYATRTLGMEFAHRLPARSPRAIAGLFAFGTLALGGATIVPGPWLVIAIAAYFTVSSAAEVLLETQLQHTIEGSARATVTSLAKMSEYVGGLAFYVYIGTIAQLWSFRSALAAVAALTFVVACVFAAFAPERDRWRNEARSNASQHE